MKYGKQQSWMLSSFPDNKNMLNTFRTVLLLTVAFGAYYFLDVGSAFRARRAPSGKLS